MKNREFLGTVEKVVLGEIEFLDDVIEVWVGIKEVSENLQSKIIQAVENEKVRSAETMQHLYGRGWKETEIKNLSLHVVARMDKTLETTVIAYFEEVENPDVFESGCFGIDLSGYEMELKGLIVRGITNKFF